MNKKMSRQEFAEEHNKMKKLFNEKKEMFPSHTEYEILELIAYQKGMKFTNVLRLYEGK